MFYTLYGIYINMKLIQQIKRSQLHKKVSDDVSIFVDENQIFVFENFFF